MRNACDGKICLLELKNEIYGVNAFVGNLAHLWVKSRVKKGLALKGASLGEAWSELRMGRAEWVWNRTKTSPVAEDKTE